MGPVYAHLNGLDTTHVAIFMAVSICAGAVTQYPVGRCRSHGSTYRDRAVCTLATLIAAASWRPSPCRMALVPAADRPVSAVSR